MNIFFIHYIITNRLIINNFLYCIIDILSKKYKIKNSYMEEENYGR